jgi:Zn-dependent protease with chaperone function
VILVLLLLGYFAAAACAAPALLTRLTRRGASARAGLALWLATLASVLSAAALAAGFAVRAAAADWPQLTATLCRSVAGQACTPAIYRSALYQAGAAALALLLLAAMAVAAWRYGRRVHRTRSQTQAHARTALLVGRALPGAFAGARPGRRVFRARTVVLDEPRPAAYCVAGRPAAIVVTRGALAVLDQQQLDAVLAHERAHGHHALATVLRGLAAAFPGVPLFARAVTEAGRLAEMAADDSAARRTGPAAVARALLALATGQRVAAAGTVPLAGAVAVATAGTVPSAALAAAAQAVPARVERLLSPTRPAAAAAAGVLLGVLSALLVLGPLLLSVLSA